MDSFQRRENAKNVFKEEMHKIKNCEELIKRLDSEKGPERIEDILIELDIALKYLSLGYDVEYEPDLSNCNFENPKPPDFMVSKNGIEFFIEVKRVLETENTRKEDIIKSDIKSRLERNMPPYFVMFSLNTADYTKWDNSMNKSICNCIKLVLQNGNFGFDTYIPININGQEIGRFSVHRTTRTAGFVSYSISLHDRIYGIKEQIKKANEKNIPEGKIFLVICKIEGHVDDLELDGSTTGEEIWTMVLDKKTRTRIDSYIEKKNIILGHPEHYNRISGVLFYTDMTDRRYALFTNKTALNKMDQCKDVIVPFL